MDCKVGDRVEMWVNINQNGDLSVSPIPTDYTLVGTLIVIDTDSTVLVAWREEEKRPAEAHQADSFSSTAVQTALSGYAWAIWVRNVAEISRVLPGLGAVCAGRYCNEFNLYGQANSSDGQYYCYSCRQRPSCLR